MYLQIKNINKFYGNTHALNNVSFNVRKGTIHAICGENGAGKSTLIKILCGLIPHGQYEGDFTIDGIEKKFFTINDSRKSRIAVIAQELALVPEMTVAENIFLGNEPRKNFIVDKDKMYDLASQAMLQLQCDIGTHTQVKELGIGKQQMIEIAKAISKNAEILILDEPTAALTEQESTTLLNLLLQLKDKGVTCILISHKLKEILKVSDDITVLRDGSTVCTMKISETTEIDLVAKMVGRTMVDFFSKEKIDIGKDVLQIKNLSSTLRNKKVMHSNVNVNVHAGEIVGIAGLMGSGRTELLQILFGAHEFVVDGSIVLNGDKILPQNPQQAIEKGIALITEDRKQYGLFLENDIVFNSTIAFLQDFTANNLMQKREMESYANENIQQLRIKANDAATKTGSLSGGNQQKVVFSKWMKKLPHVLLADEPTRGIDVGGKAEIYKEIYRLARQGTAVLVVSSDLLELIGICDRMYVMANGEIKVCLNRNEFDEKIILKHALNIS